MKLRSVLKITHPSQYISIVFNGAVLYQGLKKTIRIDDFYYQYIVNCQYTAGKSLYIKLDN